MRLFILLANCVMKQEHDKDSSFLRQNVSDPR